MMINKFRRGQTTFKCESCGRLTRQTGVQSLDSKICPDCWELGGIYNVYQDGGDWKEYKAAIIEHCANIVAKGGTLDDENQFLLDGVKE